MGARKGSIGARRERMGVTHLPDLRGGCGGGIEAVERKRLDKASEILHLRKLQNSCLVLCTNMQAAKKNLYC